MPLSADEWKEAHNRPVKEIILEFLRDNSEHGYDTHEISEGINLKLTPETKRDAEYPTRGFLFSLYRIYKVKRSCDKLVKEDKISKKFVDSDEGRTIYYRFNR